MHVSVPLWMFNVCVDWIRLLCYLPHMDLIAHTHQADVLEKGTPMKTWPVCFVLLTMTLAGCAGTENYFSLNTELNHPMFAPVGAALIEWEEGVREKSSKETSETFRRELLYSGLTGRTVNITYREYWTGSSRKLVQPVFNQDLKYELGQDGKAVITFKEVRIEVSEATNERIGFLLTHGPAGARVDAKQGKSQTAEQAPANAYPR